DRHGKFHYNGQREILPVKSSFGEPNEPFRTALVSRRKLTHQQRQRIRQQQQKHHDNVAESNAREIDDSELGPELGGIVVSHFGTQVEVEKVDSPGKTIRCHLRANLPPVATGDRVVWRQGHDLGVVVSVEPRDNALVRPDSYGKLRIVAAN